MDPITYSPDYLSPPGDTLEDVLEERTMTQAELSERTGLSRKTINEIVKGKAPITSETALQLERVFDIPARFWSSREQQYREALARREERERLAGCTDWLADFPTAKMANLGWIEKTRDKVDKLRHVLSFFGVASPAQWEEIWLGQTQNVAFRKSLRFSSDPKPMSAWLRFGEVAARSMRCASFNRERFRAGLDEIRGLTREEASVFSKEMRRICCEAGVALVFTPQLPKARVSGATRWLTPELALIQLSLRYKKDDQFWFTFFHEVAHILLHGKRDVFLEGTNGEEQEKKEAEANTWARGFLIQPDDFKKFAATNDWSHAAVDEFAREQGIAPGIVVGRMQREEIIPYSYLNGRKRTLEWSTPAAA
ncbi:MAG: ImmA/IrrE family metallo-endopeptidase [Bacteroidetes bacterium]|nr:ImmA/IrrE family metallo-endopeptidase [Bacteroidota bacterium]